MKSYAIRVRTRLCVAVGRPACLTSPELTSCREDSGCSSRRMDVRGRCKHSSARTAAHCLLPSLRRQRVSSCGKARFFLRASGCVNRTDECNHLGRARYCLPWLSSPSYLRVCGGRRSSTSYGSTREKVHGAPHRSTRGRDRHDCLRSPSQGIHRYVMT